MVCSLEFALEFSKNRKFVFSCIRAGPGPLVQNNYKYFTLVCLESMEQTGIEPATSCLQSRRSPN